MVFVLTVIAAAAVAAAGGLAALAHRVLKAAHSGPRARAAAPAGRPHAHPAAAGRGLLERAVLTTVTRLIRLLLRLGIAPGPMVMLGVQGRTTGIARTNPVDVFDGDGRRFLVATHDANANWVRNLRAAGEGTLARGWHRWTFTAVELSCEEAAQVFREVLAPRLARPLAGLVLRQTLGLAPGAEPADFTTAASDHPVFELTVTPARVAPARRPRGPVIAIIAGLAVTAAHAALGVAGVMTPSEWISGAIVGLVIAGAGNHARIFGHG
jgi:deazaflavin-dependent oxidoreductase (nitroreductase family)